MSIKSSCFFYFVVSLRVACGGETLMTYVFVSEADFMAVVENRLIGIKSRGCYETPGLTIV